MTIGQLAARSGATAEERRRILEDYLDAVFTDQSSPVADRLRMGAPELPDNPTADQVAAWVELAELLRDRDYVEAGRRMAERTRVDGSEPDGAHFAIEAVSEHAGAAVRVGVDPNTIEALAVIEHVEALTLGSGADRAQLAERIDAFTDRRVFRCWTLVGIVNGWPRSTTPDEPADAWEWYANARARRRGVLLASEQNCGGSVSGSTQMELRRFADSRRVGGKRSVSGRGAVVLPRSVTRGAVFVPR